MRVAVVTAFPRDPDWPRGGVEAVSVNLVRALAQRPHMDIHVVTIDRTTAGSPSPQVEEKTGSNRSEGTVTQWKGARIHRLSADFTSLLGFATGRGRRQIQSYLTPLRPDIVHTHDTYGIMVKGLAVPRVFTVHGFIHQDTRYQPGWLAWPRSLLWRWHETRAWADQRHIIAISPFVHKRLRGFRGEIHDIENPIAEEFFRVTRAPKVGLVFSAAAISPLKNTLVLLQAFAALQRSVPEAQLRLAGAETDAQYASRARQFVSDRGLQSTVTFLGPIRAAQMRQELGQASVFVLVSLQENAPMCIAEAMAAGLPVVAANRCGMPFMVQQRETGFLVDPLAHDEIADRIGEVLTDAPLRDRMSQRARQLAAARYHPDRIAEQIGNLYQHVIQQANDAHQ